MTSEATTRVSFRLKSDVYDLIKKLSKGKEIDPSTYIQRILEKSVYEYLPVERQKEIENMKALFEVAQSTAREVYELGRFDMNFTLTVVREMMANSETRKLYEEVIEDDAYCDGAVKKKEVNMHLGLLIKNAINAEPITNKNGKSRRAFVKGEPIKSYTLLRRSNSQ